MTLYELHMLRNSQYQVVVDLRDMDCLSVHYDGQEYRREKERLEKIDTMLNLMLSSTHENIYTMSIDSVIKWVAELNSTNIENTTVSENSVVKATKKVGQAIQEVEEKLNVLKGLRGQLNFC